MNIQVMSWPELRVLVVRQNPAIEQLLRSHSLTAEVINYQDTAVALHLHRGFTDLGYWIVNDLHGGHIHLSADNHCRSFNPQPALVIVDRLVALHHIYSLMALGIIKFNLLSFDKQSFGDKNGIGKTVGDSSGN